jgi:hypothetical protein
VQHCLVGSEMCIRDSHSFQQIGLSLSVISYQNRFRSSESNLLVFVIPKLSQVNSFEVHKKVRSYELEPDN